MIIIKTGSHDKAILLIWPVNQSWTGISYRPYTIITKIKKYLILWYLLNIHFSTTFILDLLDYNIMTISL